MKYGMNADTEVVFRIKNKALLHWYLEYCSGLPGHGDSKAGQSRSAILQGKTKKSETLHFGGKKSWEHYGVEIYKVIEVVGKLNTEQLLTSVIEELQTLNDASRRTA